MDKTQLRDEYIKMAFHSSDTSEVVARYARCRQPYVKKVWIDTYGQDAFKERKTRLYRESKLGEKNPMLGKSGDKHHLYKGDDAEISMSKGYRRTRKPEWYTGNSVDGYVLEHIAVYCAAHGLTELPEGFEIHHLDEDKVNNNIGNLIMLSASDHQKLHVWMNRVMCATTIPEGSRDDGNVPKRAASAPKQRMI